MASNDLPHWMEPNVIYLFKFDNENDKSEYFEKINCNDVVWADTVQTDGLKIKSRYCFRLELQNKIHIFCHDLATVTNNWLRGVKTGKRCEMEKARAHKDDIRKNVDMIIWLYKKKKSDQVMEYIEEEFKGSLIEDKIDETSKDVPFLKTAQRCQDNMVDVNQCHIDTRCTSSM